MPEFSRGPYRPPSSPSPEEAVRAAFPNPPRIAPPPPGRPGPSRPPAGPPAQRSGPPPAPYGYRPAQPTRPAQPAPVTARAVAVADEKPAEEEDGKPDLTMTKVIAGAGAAATSAVMGSYLGAAGTVTGAALGSVVSMVGASVYQHYLERTRDTVRARIRLPGGRTVAVTEQVEVPAPRSALDAEAPPTQVLVTPVGDSAAPGLSGTGDLTPPDAAVAAPALAPRRSGRRWLMAGAAVVLAFLIGMVAVTGIEWLKGSTLTSGESGTSVGRVIQGDGGPSATAEPDPGTSTDEDGDSDDEETSDAPSETTRSSEPTSPTDEDGDRSATRAPRSTNPTTSPTTTTPVPGLGLRSGS